MQYPLMFDTEPQWDIYTPGIEIVDPSRVQSTGLPFYKQLFWGLLTAVPAHLDLAGSVVLPRIACCPMRIFQGRF